VSTTLPWSAIALTDLVDYSVSIETLLLIWTLIIFLIWKQSFAIKMCLHAMEQAPNYFPGDAIYSREILLMHFASSSLRCSFPQLLVLMPVNPNKQSNLFNMNMTNDEGKLGSKPKIEFIHSGKPLDYFVPPTKDGSFHVEIPGIDVAI